MRRAFPWLATLVVVVLIFLLYGSTPSIEEEPLFHDLQPASVALEPTPVAPRLPAKPRVPMLQDAIATAVGRHSLTCNVGDDMPNGPALGDFQDGEVHQGMLYATSKAASGQSGVHVRRPLNVLTPEGMEIVLEERNVPQVRIAWDPRGCQVLPVVSVPLAGVVTLDGQPLPGASVQGCGVPTSTDADGTFQLVAWLGIPCSLNASAQGGTRVRRSSPIEIWPELPGLEDLKLELSEQLSAYEQALERREAARVALPEALRELEQLEAVDGDALDEPELETLARRLKRAAVMVKQLEKRAESDFSEQSFPVRVVPFGDLQPAD